MGNEAHRGYGAQSTLSKVQKIRVILRKSEHTFHLLQWLSMRKQFLKFKKIKKTFVPKIILHNYILYKGDPTYMAIFPVDSGMHQIFTDFQHMVVTHFLLENL